MNKHLSKRLASLVLALVLCLSLVAPAGAVGEEGGMSIAFEKVDNSVIPSSNSDRVVEKEEETPLYRDTDSVRVSILLEEKSTIAKGFAIENIAENASAMAYRASLQAEQETMTAKIERVTGETLDVAWNLTLAANLISANVEYGDIEAIKALPGVADVVIETRYEPDVVSVEETDPNMATSGYMTGSIYAWDEGYTGAGSKIAIIDTGTDTDHQSFDGDAFLYAIEQTGKEVDLMDANDIAKVLDKLNIKDLVDDASELYLNAKLPFAFNYVDEDFDVTHDNDSQGEHGSHVAGIATANRYINVNFGTEEAPEYDDALTVAHTQGVAPDAQLITMKVFGKGGGAYDSDYMAAIEDAVILGADSINLSLGSGNPGFSHNSTAAYQAILDSLTEAGAVVCMSAGNSGSWQENTTFGYLYNDGVSMQTDGSPGSFTNAFTVSSAVNAGSTGNFLNFGEELSAVAFTESSGYTNKPIATLDTTGSGTEYDFVLFNNTGVDGDDKNLLTDYADICKDKVVMVYRGTSSFYQKHGAAAEVGAIACIVVNNQAGTINMDLSGSTATIPCVSITQANGESIKGLATTTAVKDNSGEVLYYTGKVIISADITSAFTEKGWTQMSSFSSWGVPGSLELKPEITAPGGNIYSVNGAVEGGQAYENMSGTSMASPQVAGMVAVLAQYIRENDLCEKTGKSARFLAQSLLMSTAANMWETDSGYYYSILIQGAGLANLQYAMNAHSYIEMDETANAGAADGKVKVELGDDPDREGVYSYYFTLNNMTDEDIDYSFYTDIFTQDVFDGGDYGTFLDTWTTPLDGAVVNYKVDGKPLLNKYSFTEEDAQKVLDFVALNGGLSVEELELYDLDCDGEITTYDAHLMLSDDFVLPAGGSVEVEVTIDVNGCIDETLYPTGAYIEGFTYVVEWADGDAVADHSIPILGYYGSWTEPSMYDVGTYADFWNGTEERYPYLYYQNDLEGNFLSITYPGDTEEYYNFARKNVIFDPEYYAFNSNGSIYKYYYSLIRNAAASKVLITNVETGEVYYEQELGSKNSAYYYANGAAWYNTQMNAAINWSDPTLEDGTQIDVSLIMAPEYYVSYDEEGKQTVRWDDLDDGAYMTTRMTIDNTAPELKELTYNPETKKVTVTASDNLYLAAAILYQDGYANGAAMNTEFPDYSEAKAGDTVTVDLAPYRTWATSAYYIQLMDFAGNIVTYKFTLTEDGQFDDTTVAPTGVALEDVTVVKNTTLQLTPEFTPWLADDAATWKSADDTIATVDENGVVTGVSAGTTTITVTSASTLYGEDETPVSATCTVTVKAYEVTITGALQDVGGDPLLFTWNLDTEKTWTKTVDIENYIHAITYGWNLEYDGTDEEDPYHYNGNYMYQLDTSGYMHMVEVKTGKTVATSTSTVYCEVDDMEYAYTASQIFWTDTLFGAYGAYFVYSYPAMEGGFYYGWNLANYLSYYLGASELTAIARVGYTTNSAGNKVDVFYCLADSGDIWIMQPDLQTGSASMSYVSTDLDLKFPGYGGNYYCSMVLGDDDNLYLSYFDGSTNQIYVLEEVLDEEGYLDSLHATLLGNVGDDVWPMGILTVTNNNAETEEDDETGETDRLVDLSGIELIEVDAQSEAISLNDAPTGGLNAVKVNETVNATKLVKETAAEKNGVSVVNTGRIYLDVTAENSTNGVVSFEYDSSVLTFEGFESKHIALTSASGEYGTARLAYATGVDALNGKLGTMVFSYNKDDCPYETDVTVTTVEDGNKFELSDSTTMTVELKTRPTVTPPATNSGSDSGSGSGSGSSSGSGGSTETKLPYTDVKKGDEAYDAIKYLYEKGIMNGVGDGSVFRPDMTLDRGMVATILYRVAGEPDVEFKGVFSDITSDIYCAKAVEWAAANGIALGCPDGTFKPYEYVTLEQLAAFLSRYAEFKGVSVYDATLSDTAVVSDWAKANVAWAAAEGLLTAEQAENATRYATRAEVAVTVYTLITKTLK